MKWDEISLQVATLGKFENDGLNKHDLKEK